MTAIKVCCLYLFNFIFNKFKFITIIFISEAIFVWICLKVLKYIKENCELVMSQMELEHTITQVRVTSFVSENQFCFC